VTPTASRVDYSRTAEERVEARYSKRNLQNLLDYNFGSGRLLCLEDTKVYNAKVLSLKAVDARNLDWRARLSYWWNNQLGLRKIAEYVEKHGREWAMELSDNQQLLIRFEKQCALLDRKVAKYNQSKGRKKPIAYVNPLRKILRVSVKYPSEIGQSKQASVIYDLYFDRLTPLKQLLTRMEDVLQRPVNVIVKARESCLKTSKRSFLFNIVLKDLFRKRVQEPVDLLDPTYDQPVPDLNVVNVTFDDPDWNTASLHLFDEGQKQSMPLAYSQGFFDGKILGYREAIYKIKETLAGKL
jgi:hypothetical protein